jgi:transcriptional antiterminator RfaH
MDREYVAQTHPGAEAVADLNLRRQGFDCYVPAIAIKRRFGRDKQPIFPGYLFVTLDLSGPDRWQAVNGTRGVVRLLPSHLERPSPLPRGFVAELRGRVEGGEYDEWTVEDVVRGYAPGALVFVRSGPFAEHEGKFQFYRKGCLYVLLALLGRELSVPIPAHQVVPGEGAINAGRITTRTSTMAPQFGRRRGAKENSDARGAL